jgi:hypothetical protein
VVISCKAPPQQLQVWSPSAREGGFTLAARFSPPNRSLSLLWLLLWCICHFGFIEQVQLQLVGVCLFAGSAEALLLRQPELLFIPLQFGR